MRLREVMSEKVATADVTEAAETAWGRMVSKGINHLVVTDSNRVVGVVSERDLGGRRGVSIRKNRVVGEVMTPQPVTATTDQTVRQAANLMRGRGIGCLPVLEDEKLKGIVTVSDLLELLGRGLERPVPRTERAMLSRRQGKLRKTLISSRG